MRTRARAPGTLRNDCGVGARLAASHPGVRIVLADPAGSGLAHWVSTGEMGPDGSYAVEGIGSSRAPANLHRHVIDEAVTVSDDEGFAMVRRLVREEGLLVGGSAGVNVAAALRVAADRYRAKPWMQDWGEASISA